MALLQHPALLVALSVAPAAAVLAYSLYVARSAPEPWSRILLSCVAGGVAFAAAGQLQSALRPLLPHLPLWAWAVGVVAPVEEVAKLAAVLVGGRRPTRYERIGSGLVYGVAAGVGFACAENVFYVLDFGATAGVLRAFTTVPAHALHAALLGIALGMVHRSERPSRQVGLVAAGLALAIGFHAAYDAILVGAGPARGLVVLLLVAEVLVVRWAARALLERDQRGDMARLATVPAFQSLPAACLRILASGATHLRVPSGRAVVRQGEAGSTLYFVLKGSLEVRVDGAPVSALGEGEYFGEQSVLTGDVRTADVVAVEESFLLRVPRALLLRAVGSHPELARTLTAGAQKRFRPGTLGSARQGGV